MNQEKDFFDRLDQLAAGRLSPAEQRQLEAELQGDEALRNRAEEHLRVVSQLKAYRQREDLRRSLDFLQEEVAHDTSQPPPAVLPEKDGFLRKFWPTIAIAASVALVSITGTLITSHSLEEKQSAYYKELVRNVDQIKKSQHLILADIVSKQKEDPFPGKYTGTGFLISARGFIATSYHVIKGADSVYVQNEQFGRIKTRVIYSDPANDVAILKIDPEKSVPQHPLPFAINPEEANLGEGVFTLGFPREDIVFGEGSISASTGYRQNSNAYQVSVPVNPGNSGGPLMNEKGDVIGIISGIQTETSGAAFAIKSRILLEVIKEVPDSLKTSLVLSKQSYLRNATRVQQIKKWKEFVFMVKVYNK